ncbi:ATP-binding protein [Aquabacterium sp.]|uniref:ATP-binding protein n=1 Tax=Aquabacterium sp. TaxID=1872578 RepID=UPI0024898543|nr:ATP-binding protein [Aquabacterium sp.]MDI1258308.1 ATP-binding protein [Aquabacterium sp.]
MPHFLQNLRSRLSKLHDLFHWPLASLRGYLTAVIIVATVPMSGLACYLVVQETLAGNQALEDSLLRTASTFALTVEREMVSSIDALAILSYSDSLQRDDVAGFFATLTALPKMRSTWSSAYLLELNGDVIFNTRQPPGKPLEKISDRSALERLIRTGGPEVTSLMEGPNGQRTTGVLVPVFVQGKVKYALGAWITPANWQKLMNGVTIAPGGFVSIFDSRFQIIARSLDPQRFVGQPLPLGAQQVMGDQIAGIQRAQVASDKSTDVYVAWKRIPLANWGIGVGVPAAPIDRNHARSIATALGAGMLSLAAGLALAMLVARRVTKPLQQLAVGGPQAVQHPSEVRELALLQSALRVLEMQRELARERLQAKADEFETLFQNSPIGLAIAQDKDCHSVLRNPALAAMFNELEDGHLPPHVVLKEGQELLPDEQPLKHAALTGAKTSDVELDVVHQDGRALRLIAHAAPLYDHAGRPRGAIGAYTDITERKHAEEALITAERRLRESQHMVELAQAAGHVGFFDYEFVPDRTTWTSGMAPLFGIKLAEFDGTWDAWIKLIDESDRQQVQDTLQTATRQKQEQAVFEFRTSLPDRSVRWLSGRVVLKYDESGQPLHMIGVMVDATQQKSVELARADFVAREQAARVEAENANRAKDEFLAMLGHELRNPLGAIAAASEVLNRLGSENPAALSARQIISRQTRHLARLMDDLLDVARVITGKIMLTRHPLDLAQATQRLVTTLEVSGMLKSHTLQIELEEVWVQADGTRIEQIIYNLLTNALKYTPDGGHVKATVRKEGDMGVLEVSDSGVGMTEPLLSRVFDLFVQGDRSLDRRQGGLGIGLTLVRRLTELHGGNVAARSEGHQQGSTFIVRLPLVAPESTALPGPQDTSMPNRHVVVVEDNEDVREALQVLLSLAGHSVFTAEDGQAGAQLVIDTQPDIALIDIGLPKLNGYEAARLIRQAGYKGQLVALSGYGQPKDVAQALEAGFDAHLVKPVDPRALEALMNKV